MLSGFYRTLMTAQSAGAALVASTIGAGVMTSLLPAQAAYPLKGQAIAQIGERLKVSAAGILTSSGTPVTLTFAVLADNTQIWTSGAITPAASDTNSSWSLDVELDVRVVGTAAQVFGIGKLGGALSGLAPATSPALGTAFDATVPHIITFGVSFGANTAGNQITLEQYALASLVGAQS
jgi:hypothetical protein